MIKILESNKCLISIDLFVTNSDAVYKELIEIFQEFLESIKECKTIKILKFKYRDHWDRAIMLPL